MAWYFQTFDGYTDFYNLDSWVEISSQPSSSSLSSVNDEVITTGLRVQHDPRTRRRRTAPSNLNIAKRASSIGATSSQEEYEESESESDRVMTSSGEGPILPTPFYSSGLRPSMRPTLSDNSVPHVSDDDDDENRTAINYPINDDACFTPQPNAFSHPPSRGRHASLPTPGSYFPTSRPGGRPANRPAYASQPSSGRPSHLPQNILSPSYNAAAQHDEALRASLTTLLSCAAAARGLSRPSDNEKRANVTGTPAARTTRVEPLSLRLIPESALPVVSSPPQFQEPTFKPTIRRTSTSTSAASSEQFKDHKRKATSRERRGMKKVRRSASAEDLQITPTLLTWVVSAGVVVVLSALSFSAGYSIGKEAGMLEAGTLSAEEGLRTCAQEAGRTSLGLKRSLARSAVV